MLALSVILFEVLMVLFVIVHLPAWFSISDKVDEKTPLITNKGKTE